MSSAATAAKRFYKLAWERDAMEAGIGGSC